MINQRGLKPKFKLNFNLNHHLNLKDVSIFLKSFRSQISGLALATLCFLAGIGAASTSESAPKEEPTLKLAMTQINITVGDFEGTYAKIKAAYLAALDKGIDLLVTPEAVLPGYPAGDLVENPDFIWRADLIVQRLQKLTAGKSTGLLVGHITKNPSHIGKKLINVASLFADGKLVHRHQKMLLPTYDVFDDSRHFEPGRRAKPFEFKGFRIGVLICEDWWFNDKHGDQQLYRKNPSDALLGKIDLAISLSSSPFYVGKGPLRESVHSVEARKLGVPLIYVNSVGGIDQIQMDGASFVLNSSGEIVGRLAAFAEDESVVQLSLNAHEDPQLIDDKKRTLEVPNDQELVLQSLIQGLRDYMRKTGQKKVALGLSGGLDSGVSAAIAVQALGPENVIVIKMPSSFSSQGSLADADASIQALGIPQKNVFLLPIGESFEAITQTLEKEFLSKGFYVREGSFVKFENVQARIRMIFEQFLSNHFPGTIKLLTSNKSEIAMGYSTIYGDSSGKISVLGDLYKTEVRELGRYINRRYRSQLIPESTLEKPPSAELRPGQLTENEIPPYEILDPLLKDLIENQLSVSELKKKYDNKLDPRIWPNWVEQVLNRFHINEWKRDIGTVVIKVSKKAFGWGRRVPITGLKFQPVTESVNGLACEKSLK